MDEPAVMAMPPSDQNTGNLAFLVDYINQAPQLQEYQQARLAGYEAAQRR